MGMILLELCALVGGMAVIGIFFCWLEQEEPGRMSDGWRRGLKRDE